VIGDGAYDGEMTDVALFMNALRVAVPTEPDPRLGADLVPRLAAAARPSTIEAETQVMRRRSAKRTRASRRRRSRLTLARVAIAIVLIPLVLAGLAVAGVTVPSPARSALDSVGVTLPNQPSQETDEGAAEQSSQPATKGTSEPGKSGTQSKGNWHAAHQHALAQHAKVEAKAESRAIGQERGKAIGLNELTPPGLSGETGPPAHSHARGSSSSHTPPPHPTGVPSGKATGHSNKPPTPSSPGDAVLLP
jgi:cell division protein FtsN